MKRWRFWWAIFVIVGVLLIVFSALSAHAQPYGAVQDGPIASDAALVVRHGARHLDSVWTLPGGEWTVCREMERCRGGEFARIVWMPEPVMQRAMFQLAIEERTWKTATAKFIVTARTVSAPVLSMLTTAPHPSATSASLEPTSERLEATTQTRRRPSDPPSAPSPSCVAHPESAEEVEKIATCNHGAWIASGCALADWSWLHGRCDAIYAYRHQASGLDVEQDFVLWMVKQTDANGNALYDSPAADCPWSLSLHRPDYAARSTEVTVSYNGRYKSARTFELQPVGCADCTVAVVLPCYRQAPTVDLNWSVR